jgi:hypothetical protein
MVGFCTSAGPNQSAIAHDEKMLSQIENFAQFVSDKNHAETFLGASTQILHQLMRAGCVDGRSRLVEYEHL